MTAPAIPRTFHGGRAVLHQGDCPAVMDAMPEASVDLVLADPPYHFASIVARFGAPDSAPCSAGRDGSHARLSRGFMGQTWDGGTVAFEAATWSRALRVLKPGGHLLAFAAPKNAHWLGVAIEQAGFEMRDRLLDLIAGDARVRAFLASLDAAQREAFLCCVAESEVGPELHWVFGSGFPKSHSPSLFFEKTLCAKRNVAPAGERPRYAWFYGDDRAMRRSPPFRHPEAMRWAGTGTALKPGYEPIFLARKPLAGSVGANLSAHGTGALAIDGCRVGTGDDRSTGGRQGTHAAPRDWGRPTGQERPLGGRWPSHLVHDGSQEVVAGFPSAAGALAPVRTRRVDKFRTTYGAFSGDRDEAAGSFRGDTGSAARFFYAPKADKADRAGSNHPTVKPVDLLRWLIRLTLPGGGTVLDPFAGSGTTGAAALLEGCDTVLIEQVPAYCADIARRLAAVRPAQTRNAGPEAPSAARPVRRRRGASRPLARAAE